MASNRQCHLIGILGSPNAGKTASLVSLYLKAAGGQMADYRFGNSRSLIAFEQLSRGARRWEEGAIPTQLTAHTKLEDPRSPGFLHLRLRRRCDEAAFDLLFPDLPGEWTEQFADTNEKQRLAFLASAHAIWLMVDGRLLADVDRRKDPIGRLKLILARLGGIIAKTIPIYLVVTRRDQTGELDSKLLEGVIARAEMLGFVRPKIFQIAPFSEDPATTAPAFGIEELVTASLAEPELPAFANAERPPPVEGRQMIRHRASNG